MLEFLMQYAMFFAKTITLVVAVLFVIVTIFALKQKGKTEDETLLISPLNDKLHDTTESIQKASLKKSEFKKWRQAQNIHRKNKEKLPRMFVIKFDGDIKASHVDELKEIVSLIIFSANQDDSVLCILESAGGLVHSYGLAAAQLERLRQANIHLTVAVDKIAASGGYLMAAVADKIIAAPFAIIGSIGVLAQIPNFNRVLEKYNIDFEQHTAGKYKRTLTMFGQNDDEGREKFIEDINNTHSLFKHMVSFYRQQLDLEKVATGEYWYGQDAIKLNLVDELQTSDDFILSNIKDKQLFELEFAHKQSVSDKIIGKFFSCAKKEITNILYKKQHEVV